MKTITIKMFSLCGDFGDFEEMYDELSKYTSPDTYIMLTANSDFPDTVESRLIDLGANEGEEVLIYIDY